MLYIDDRAVIVDDMGDYLGWLISALSTSTGHFLSLGKSSLEKGETVFIYLGIGTYFSILIPVNYSLILQNSTSLMAKSGCPWPGRIKFTCY